MRNRFLGTGEAGYHPLRKIRVVIAGLRFAVRYDFSVTYKLVVSIAFISAAGLLRQWVDFVVILLATGLVLTAELLNSAIETLCDFLETGPSHRIGAVKDVAAAAVGISIMVWIIVIIYEGWKLVGIWST
ncbi:MAG: diacylglycerol kinase [Nocardioides sp.]